MLNVEYEMLHLKHLSNYAFICHLSSAAIGRGWILTGLFVLIIFLKNFTMVVNKE